MCFFISIIIFFSSIWFFFIISNSLLNFSLCSSIFFSTFLSIFMNVTRYCLSDRLFVSILLSSSGVLSCSFICSIFLCCLFWPNFVIYFCVFGRLVTFSDLGEVALSKRYPLQLYALGPSMWASWALLLWRVKQYRHDGRGDWPLT